MNRCEQVATNCQSTNIPVAGIPKMVFFTERHESKSFRFYVVCVHTLIHNI